MKINTLYLYLLAFSAAALPFVVRGQADTAPNAAQATSEFGPEIPALYGAAIAKVNQDPEYIKAMDAVRKAQRAADEMLYAKLRKIEPRIKAYADYLEELRYPKKPADTQKTQ